MFRKRLLVLLGVGMGVATCCNVQATWTINWASSLDGPQDMIQSDGTPIPNTGFTFAIGSFGSFTPTLSNMNLWGANFKTFDHADYTYSGPGDHFFSGAADLFDDRTSSSPFTTPSATFPPGEQVYIWIYNSMTFAPTSEWALITGPQSGSTPDEVWQWPSNIIPPPCCADLDWNLVDATTPPIFGGVNSERGPGGYSSTPPNFQVQTAQVPEPTSVVLLLGGLALLGWNSRRIRLAA